MPDEHESAAATWLDRPETKREMLIVAARFPGWSDHQVAVFVLGIETLEALHLYGADDTPEDPPIDLPTDDDDPQGWTDSEGWMP